MTAISGLLRNVPLLSGLSDDQLKSVAAIAERCLFKPGDMIIEWGIPTNAAFYLIDGAVETLPPAKSDLEVMPVLPGSTLLELAMIVEIEPSSAFVARGPVKMLKIGREPLAELLREDSVMNEALLTSLTTRLNEVAAAMREADETFAGLQATA